MKKNVNILLITSSSGKGFYIAPPLGLHCLKAYLTKRKFQCDILDLDIDSKEKYLQRVSRGIYDIIGMSVSHWNMAGDLDLLWKFRSISKKSGKKCLFIAGGQEATLNCEQWLKSGIDLILLGFAEKTLYTLCKNLSDKDIFDIAGITTGMKGVAYLDKGGFPVYRPSEVITESEFEKLFFDNVLELDIPYGDYWRKTRRDTLNINFNKNKFVIETARLYTSSHCPSRCGFCSSCAFIPLSQQKISPVIRLSAALIHKLVLHYVGKYGMKGFLFSDDDFLGVSNPDLERIFDFCRMVTKSKHKGELPEDIVFNCQAKVASFITREGSKKVINDKLIKSLKEAGFNSVSLGVETFSNRLLKCPSINKSGINRSDCVMVIDALFEAGLIPQIDIILTIPESTVEELIQSMLMSVKYVRQGCQISITPLLKAAPGAAIYDSGNYAIRENKWVNIYNKNIVSISDYVIPHDPRVREIADRIEESAADELEKVKINTPWKGSTVPKFLVGLVVFISVAKLLKRCDLEEYFRQIISEILNKTESLYV